MPDDSGWDQVIDMPEAPPGKEVVWWYPPGWVVRLPKPDDISNAVWKWDQTSGRWVAYSEGQQISYVDAVDPAEQVVSIIPPVVAPVVVPVVQTSDIVALSSSDITSF